MLVRNTQADRGPANYDKILHNWELQQSLCADLKTVIDTEFT